MPEIFLDGVSKWFLHKGKKQFALSDASLKITQGEFVSIVGGSGAGKSTLLSVLCGDLPPDSGNAYLDGHEMYHNKHRCGDILGLSFGKVRQEVMLIRRKTVGENLELAAAVGDHCYKGESGTRKSRQERIEKALSLVGMRNGEHRYPEELSAGEVRRVELARAMINNPAVLALDEITANLDEDNAWDIFQLLIDINRLGTTIILATHAKQYVNVARRRVITLVNGEIFGDVERGRYGDIV